MIIKYQDIELNTHEIDLSNAVNVVVNGFKISDDGDELNISLNDAISINPIASNTVNISKRK